MRTVIAAALLAALAAAPYAQDNSRAHSKEIERSFVTAGKVNLDLAAGDCVVRHRDDNKIRVAWSTRTAEQLAEAKVDVTVRGNEAEIETSGPGGTGDSRFRVNIELPRRTDLHLRMSAGDLTITGIEGNKDVQLRAGDLTIEVADPKQYRRVDASVTAGDIAAQPFGYTTGGLFRKFAHTGPGQYDLRASLWAGDLKFIPLERK